MTHKHERRSQVEIVWNHWTTALIAAVTLKCQGLSLISCDEIMVIIHMQVVGAEKVVVMSSVKWNILRALIILFFFFLIFSPLS